MCAQLNADLSQYTPQDFTPIPPAKYDFEINDTDVVNTTTGKRMIKVSCKVLGPTHVGRIVFENFVVGQEVAMIRLKTLATASGHPRPDYIQDTQELHGLRFRGNVGIKKSDGYADQNNIKSFEKIPAPTGVAQPPFVPAQPAPTPTNCGSGGQTQTGNAPSFSPPPLPPQNALPPVKAPPVSQPPLTAPAATGKPSAPWMK